MWDWEDNKLLSVTVSNTVAIYAHEFYDESVRPS